MTGAELHTPFPESGGAGGETAPSLTVIGTCNMDLMARVQRLPQTGETILGRSFMQRSGGKGSNQAVAAARQGLAVSLVSAVGDDPFGAEILEGLIAEGIDVSHVSTVPGSSGIAMIVVDDAGENTIVVIPGAGDHVSLDDCDLTAPNAVLAQLEVPVELVTEAAARTSGLFCLNASPFVPLPAELERGCDLIIVNQVEYEAGREQLDAAALVCVTLGAAGARLLDHGRQVATAPSPKVEVVDTVGAGDAFVAALVAEILRTNDPARALEIACRAGSLATTRRGAQASLPYRTELT